MADRNLDIALRIKAELDGARGQVERLNKSIENTGKSSSKAASLNRDQTAALSQFLAKLDPTIGKLDQLDKKQAQLATLKRSGWIDDETFARFNTLLDKQRAGLDKSGKSMHTFGLNTAQTRRELGFLAKDMATGQWGRFTQTSMTLANYSGLTSLAFSATGLAIMGVVGALGLLAAATVKGYLENERLARSIIVTGNYAGTTTGEVTQLAASLSAINGRGGQAREILNGLIGSGRIAGDALDTVGRAAVSMAALTGKSAQEVVAEWTKVADDPVRAALELDKQYHFLNTTLFQQIQTLQQAGNQYEALKLVASSFADDTANKMDELHRRMGWMETFADRWSRGVDRIKSGLQDIGRPDDETDKFQAALAKYNKIYQAYQDSLSASSTKGYRDTLFAQAQAAYKELQAAQAAALKVQSDAAAKGVAKQVQAEGVAAAASIDQLTTSLDRAKQRQEALNKASLDLYKIHLAGGKLPEGINFDGPTADTPQGAGWVKLKAEIEKRYADPKVPKTKDTTNALAAAQKQLQDQILSLGDKALGPVTGIWDQYTKAMLAAGTAGGKAIKAGGDVAAVQAQVAEVQQLAAQARDRALADQSRGLNIAYLTATGQQAEAAKLQIEQQYGELLADLQRRGDEAGVRLVKSLINVGEARAQLQQLQQQVDMVLASQGRQEQGIQAEQQAGLISEYSARKQILDLHHATAAQLDALLPKMRELVAATGDPRAVEQLKNLEAELGRLKLQTNDLKTAFESGLTSGLEQALVGLATRTMTVGEAFKSLARTVIASLAQVAARALAAKAIEGLGNLFGGGDKKADVGAGAAKLALAGGIVGGASALLGTSADKLQAAAATLMIANSIGAVGGFAEGGYTGHGGKYQVAGVVHRGEGVLSQREIAAIGGPSGFHALRQAISVGYADGGYVNPLNDAPRISAAPTRTRLPSSAANDARGPGAQVALRNVNIIDPALVSDYLDSSDGETSVMNIISRNETKIRQMAR